MPKKRQSGEFNHDFFSTQQPWRWYKHEVVRRYLHVWCSKLRSRYKMVAFVDGFAGAGAFGSEPGSPVIAASWNDKPMLSKGPLNLCVYACERDPQTAAALRRSLRPWIERQPPLAHVFDGEFQRYVYEILTATDSTPTLFFIDPFGPSDVAWDQLQPILNARGRAPTELLLRIDPVSLARLAGWLQDRERPEAQQRAAQTIRGSLLRFGLNADELASQLSSEKKIPSKWSLLEMYLGVLYSRFRWVQIVGVRSEYHHDMKYALVHCTESPHGAVAMNDIVSKIEEELRQRSDNRKHGEQLWLMPVPMIDPGAAISVVAENIKETLSHQSPMPWILLRAELAMRLQSEFREKHHKAGLQLAIADGDVSAAPGPLRPSTEIRLC